MNKSYDEVLDYLEKNVEARERKNKGRVIRVMLIKKYPALEAVPKDVMLKAIKSMETYDRSWRRVTRLNKHLRGKDYGRKHELVEQKLEELGYQTKVIIS